MAVIVLLKIFYKIFSIEFSIRNSRMDEVADTDRKKINENHSSVEGDLDASTSSNAMALAIAETSITIDEPSPEIFKLNIDCFGPIFEWFSLKELLEFRYTCKQMKTVIDLYIKLKYPRLLRQFIHKPEIWLEFCQIRLSCFEWIKHLQFSTKLAGTHDIDSVTHILNQLESLELWNAEIDGEFYETLLKHCPNLKYLGVRTNTLSKWLIGTGNEWLRRGYPMLEHFKMLMGKSSREQSVQYTELSIFFQQNPNIRIFSIDDTLLSINRGIFLGSNIKLERLDINTLATI